MTTLPDLPAVTAAIIEITNAKRVEAKLARVTVSRELTAAAKAYADVLARSKVLSHTADGSTMSARIEKSGYSACSAAENLAMRQSSRGFATRELAVSAMEGWLNSPGHAKNIMLPDATEIGVAIAKAPDTDPRYLLVQLFGRPSSLAFEFQVSNTSTVPVTLAFGGKTTVIEPKTAVSSASCDSGSLVLKASGPRAFEARYQAASKNYVVSEPEAVAKAPLTVEVRDLIRVK